MTIAEEFIAAYQWPRHQLSQTAVHVNTKLTSFNSIATFWNRVLGSNLAAPLNHGLPNLM